jgi:hypothetical protein
MNGMTGENTRIVSMHSMDLKPVLKYYSNLPSNVIHLHEFPFPTFSERNYQLTVQPGQFAEMKLNKYL